MFCTFHVVDGCGECFCFRVDNGLSGGPNQPSWHHLNVGKQPSSKHLSHFGIPHTDEVDATHVCAQLFTALAVPAVVARVLLTTNVYVFVEGKAE